MYNNEFINVVFRKWSTINLRNNGKHKSDLVNNTVTNRNGQL